MTKPNPGSPEAATAGCLCPEIDNDHGRGYAQGPDGPVFVIREDCPIHGGTIERDADGKAVRLWI